MTKTRDKILQTACDLFNQHGYFPVTIRQIATALGISSGNLNYHFRTREDILETLYFDMVTHFDARVAALPQQEFSLAQMRDDILGSMKIMLEYRFFWTDLYQLLRQSDRIQDHFNTALQNRKQGYAFLFQALRERQWLRPAAFPDEYELLAKPMIHFSNTWLYAAVLYPEIKIDDAYINQQADALLLMLHPYFRAEEQVNLLQFLGYADKPG